MKTLKWLIGVPVGLFAMVFLFFLVKVIVDPESSKKAEEKDRAECVKAITSSIGTNTTNYRDKQAYDAHVSDKCRGYNLGK